MIPSNAYFYSCGDDGVDPYKKQVREMFNRLAGSDNEIDAEELQDILTICLKQGISQPIVMTCVNLHDHIIHFTDKLNTVFDIAACRLMIAILDVSLMVL